MELSLFVTCIMTVVSLASADPTRQGDQETWQKTYGKGHSRMIFQELGQLLSKEISNEMPKYVDQILSDAGLEELTSIPDEKDWRVNGYVSDVKNQGHCASCWAFTAAATLEGQLFNNTNNLITLSEQNLVDCAHSYKNKGCNAGWVHHAYKYIRDNGIEASSMYPYTAKKGDCSFTLADSVGSLIGYGELKRTTEAEIMKIVAKHGPISVSVFMSEAFLQFTGTDIFDDPYCNQKPNHVATLVGYVNKATEKYWIIKNSWGKSWGNDGFMKMIMGKNMCGITHLCHYPIVA
uniref:procathepsin L-like n=1 Tax=Pristiophorus japonicus TaxID=55135 RepID=UPI00398EEC1B